MSLMNVEGENSTEAMTSIMYKKRTGTSGIRGQLYETKLLSLINFRAIHDACIEEFYLATNVDNIGAFDDICFRGKIKGFDRPVVVFIQAKHKDNDKLKFDTKNDLAKYFDSYLKIRRKFEPNNEDVLFDGHFDETDCLFVMYTSARDNPNNDLVLVESNLANMLNDLIGTGDAAKQSNQTQEDVEFLCKTFIKEQMITLAEKLAKLIFDKCNVQMLLTDELVLRYHVILAQKVIDVSEIQTGDYRNANLRQDFFDTNEEFLFLLKETLYKLVLKEKTLKPSEETELLTAFFKKPTEIEILSELIGNILDYNDEKFEFIDKTTADSLKRQLSQVYVSQSTVKIAIERAAKKLLSRKFKVPAAFGNRDITVGSDTKSEKRLNHLTLKINELINKSDANYIVTIDDSLGTGLLKMNGGIASAVGNILVSDENTKLMKFTDNCESLGDLAKRFLEKLKDKIDNLHKYRLEVKVKKFPKLSFDASEHEENLARDFLNKLLFYTKQADESGVEEILKSDIEDDQRNNVNNVKVRSDAIFLKYHDEIQKWWMKLKQAPYLTNDIEIYNNVIQSILKDPLTNVLHFMYMNKIKNIDYTFNEEAVNSLNLQDQRTVIVAKSIVLTVLKVIQYVKHKEYVVLDLEYILGLQKDDRNALCAELTKTDEEKTLILICDRIKNSGSYLITLRNVAKAIFNKQTLFIANSTTVAIIEEIFSSRTVANNLIYDTRNNLRDMSDESQQSILQNKMIFQGIEMSLDLIVDEDSMSFVHGDILNKIISKDIIEVGKSVGNSNYDEMKHLYVDRRVTKPGDEIGKIIETLNDIEDKVVLITALPGMGKSTLLTHLSLKTKEVDPKVWIVRINLLEYSSVFGKWRENKTVIGSLEAVNFMCHVILNEKLGEEKTVSISLGESNGVVYLKECSADEWVVFELKMFLHYYNTKNLIFVFDGFDEICPHYADDVIKCINIVKEHPRQHKIWIASRGYTEIKSLLECQFGTSHKIDPFSYGERRKYLGQYWNYNLILEDLDEAQLDNVKDFIQFMLTLKGRGTPFFEFNLLEIYCIAMYTLTSKLKCSYIPLWKHNINFNDEYNVNDFLFYTCGNRELSTNSYEIPLHLYLIADYFQNEIKDVTKKTERWNLDINTHTIYERFIETKFKKIRFQEKNKMDVYIPDIMITMDKERTEFIMKHNKLAAYAIFHQYAHVLFDEIELNEIEGTIQLLKNGLEKTGLICGTADDVPMFIHMSFAEYFAAEYVCDALKNENCSEKQQTIIDLIFNVTFASYRDSILELLDFKMKTDKVLARVFKSNKKIVFTLLMNEGKFYLDGDNGSRKVWIVTSIMLKKLHNFMHIFLLIFKNNLNENNLDEFLEIITATQILRFDGYGEFIAFVIKIVRKIDKSKLNTVLHNNFRYLPRDKNYEPMTPTEIVEYIHNYQLLLKMVKKVGGTIRHDS